jgi:hypothetical protein
MKRETYFRLNINNYAESLSPNDGLHTRCTHKTCEWSEADTTFWRPVSASDSLTAIFLSLFPQHPHKEIVPDLGLQYAFCPFIISGQCTAITYDVLFGEWVSFDSNSNVKSDSNVHDHKGESSRSSIEAYCHNNLSDEHSGRSYAWIRIGFGRDSTVNDESDFLKRVNWGMKINDLEWWTTINWTLMNR